jgi:2-succinyl-5-enolpyruvyl-6-hydroxy-3-cyclohexene-1-carboxylate synthase
MSLNATTTATYAHASEAVRTAEQTRAAEALMAAFASECAHVVASPGSRSTPLVLAADAHQELQLHVVLDERAAAFVALGLARETGLPVLMLCTSGSAGAHYLPALCEARQCRIPLIVLTADRPPELHNCGAPQTMPQANLFGAHVVSARDITDLAAIDAGEAALCAMDLATGPRGGPVHLNIAFRKPLWTPPASVGLVSTVGQAQDNAPGRHREDPARQGEAAEASRWPPPTAAVILNDQSELCGLSEVYRAAVAAEPRGVIHCGADTDSRTGEAAHALAKALGWPVFAASSAAARWQEDAPSLISAHEAIVRSQRPNPPDVVIQIGRAPLSRQTLAWLAAAPTQLLLDAAGDRHDPLRTGATLIQGDPATVLGHLCQTATGPATGWFPWWQRADRAAEAAIAGDDDTNWEGAVIRVVLRSLRPGSTVHVAASMPIRDMNAFGGTAKVLRVHANRGVNGIDGLIATAAGESLAAGRATLICGDLAFLHDVGGLLAAGALRVQLDVVVINNQGGGIFAHLPISEHRLVFDRLFRTPQPTRIAPLVAACHGTYTRTSAIDELRGVLASRVDGVRVVEHVVDRHASHATRDGVWRRVAASLPRVETRHGAVCGGAI